MRCALGSFAIGCSFVLAGTVLGQDSFGPATTPRQFLEQSQEAPAPPPLEIAPVEEPPLTDEVPIVPQRRIQFEAAIIHLKSTEDPTPEEQAVTGETLDELLQNWKANGKVERMSTFTLSSLERQQASVQTGEQVPVVTGRTTFGSGGRGGAFQSSVSYQDVGTLLRVTGRIEGSNITVDCEVEESRLSPGTSIPMAAPPVADPGEQGPAGDRIVNVPILGRTSVQTTVTVPDGGKIILSGGWSKTTATTEAGERTESNAAIIALKATILP